MSRTGKSLEADKRPPVTKETGKWGVMTNRHTCLWGDENVPE